MFNGGSCSGFIFHPIDTNFSVVIAIKKMPLGQLFYIKT